MKAAFSMAMVLFAAGCAFGPADPDPDEQTLPMDAVLIKKPMTLELIPVNGHQIPGVSLGESLATLMLHVAGPIRIKQGQAVAVSLDADGYVTDAVLNNILGFRTLTGAGTVTVVMLPKMRQHNRGFAGKLADGGNLIVLYGAAMDSFFGIERTWELVLTHEFGHLLGVPHDRGHKWSANHCTYPTCLMYPGPDFRSVWSVIVNLGAYDDYCETCTTELKEARNGH